MPLVTRAVVGGRVKGGSRRKNARGVKNVELVGGSVKTEGVYRSFCIFVRKFLIFKVLNVD